MERILYNILGAGRSGTSLTAKLLSELGVFFGDDNKIKSGDCFNPMGYFENRDIYSINDMITCENNLINGIDLPILEDIHTCCQGKMRETLKELLRSDSEAVGIKDTNMSAYRKLWSPVFSELGLHEKVIVIFRHPYESVNSIVKQSSDRFARRIPEFDFMMLAWISINSHILKTILEFDQEDILILHHKDYFEHPHESVEKIRVFVQAEDKGCDVSGLIDAGLKRYNYKRIEMEDRALTRCANELYRFLIELSEGKAVVTEDIVDHYMGWADMLCKELVYRMDDSMRVKYPLYFLNKKKIWCLTKMVTSQKSIEETWDNYFRDRGISELSVYGNGMLAEELYPVLAKCQAIRLKNIYDQHAGVEVAVGEKLFTTRKWCGEEEQKEPEFVINTLFYYESVSEMLQKSVPLDQMISLFDLLNIDGEIVV